MCAIIADSLMSTSNEMCGAFFVRTVYKRIDFKPHYKEVGENLACMNALTASCMKALTHRRDSYKALSVTRLLHA